MVKKISRRKLRDELVVRDLATLRVVSDRLRMSILEALGAGAATVKAVAAKIGMAAGKLYYHFDLLERHGLIKVARTRMVSGIAEKAYVTAARSFRVDRALLSPGKVDRTLETLLSAVIDGTRADIERSVRAGVLKFGKGTAPEQNGVFLRAICMLTPAQAVKLSKALQEVVHRHGMARPSERAGSQPYGLSIAFFPVAKEET